MNYKDIMTYGDAQKVSRTRKQLMFYYTVLCNVTPCTSWSLIFIKYIIKGDLFFIIRYEGKIIKSLILDLKRYCKRIMNGTSRAY